MLNRRLQQYCVAKNIKMLWGINLKPADQKPTRTISSLQRASCQSRQISHCASKFKASAEECNRIACSVH